MSDDHDAILFSLANAVSGVRAVPLVAEAASRATLPAFAARIVGSVETLRALSVLEAA